MALNKTYLQVNMIVRVISNIGILLLIIIACIVLICKKI
jgi:hypothetical protein